MIVYNYTKLKSTECIHLGGNMDNRKVMMNSHTNLLQLEEHLYHLVDVEQPNTFRNLFPYSEVP